MAIWENGHEVTSIHEEGHDVQEIWQYINGAWRNVWQAIRSCFGRGFWNNQKPWRNEDGWKN